MFIGEEMTSGAGNTAAGGNSITGWPPFFEVRWGNSELLESANDN
jgi:hypothetical protein